MTPEEREQQLLEQRQEEADKELSEALRKIFKKPVPYLTLEDKKFLQARREYLNKDQTEKYEDVLNEKLPRSDGQPNKQEEKEIEVMTRKELEIMAETEGLTKEEIKKARTNADLQDAIRAKQEEKEKGE
jgi:hypothetical protein